MLGCSSAKTAQSNQKIQQGIEGHIYKITGNQMPMVGVPKAEPVGISTTLFIYQASNIKDVTQMDHSPFYQSISTALVTTVQSDSTGHFIVQLPAGSYSLFTKINNLFFANSFDANNNIALIHVEEGKLTIATIKLNGEATY